MKLPFSNVLGPLIKPHLGESKIFCENPFLAYRIPYTYFCACLGLLLSTTHLFKHFGENPTRAQVVPYDSVLDVEKDFMLVHDLKIVATSFGILQYICLLVGCYTENPALILPHLLGQVVILIVKVVNTSLLIGRFNKRSLNKFICRLPVIVLMVFTWLQELCLFTQYLCICDL